MMRKGDREIRDAFAGALPSHDWKVVASRCLVVALMDARDWRPWLSDAMGLLDAAEMGRVQRKRKTGDRETLVLSYALHRLLLGHVLGTDAAAVPLWRDESGRPRVGDDAFHTSLSHADAWVAVAVCGAGAVGVDIEPVTRMGMLPEIAASICHPLEAAEFKGLDPHRYGRALLALWVRKEALLKAAGVGLSKEMSSFPAPEGDLPSLQGSEVTRLQMLDAGPACLAAVAGPLGVPLVVVRLVPVKR